MIAEELQQYIDRIEKLEEQVSNLRTDIRGVYAEARGKGIDTKALREVIKLRKKNKPDRDEFEYLRAEYKNILGL